MKITDVFFPDSRIDFNKEINEKTRDTRISNKCIGSNVEAKIVQVNTGRTRFIRVFLTVREKASNEFEIVEFKFSQLSREDQANLVLMGIEDEEGILEISLEEARRIVKEYLTKILIGREGVARDPLRGNYIAVLSVALTRFCPAKGTRIPTPMTINELLENLKKIDSLKRYSLMRPQALYRILQDLAQKKLIIIGEKISQTKTEGKGRKQTKTIIITPIGLYYLYHILKQLIHSLGFISKITYTNIAPTTKPEIKRIDNEALKALQKLQEVLTKEFGINPEEIIK